MPKNLESLPRLIDISELAERFSVCTKTIRRLVDAGELVSFGLGASVRITEESAIADLRRVRR